MRVMKHLPFVKFLYFVNLLLCLMIFFCSCDSKYIDLNENDNSNITQKNEEKNGEDKSEIVTPIIERKTLSFFSYDEYLEFINSSEVTKSFVKYNTIEQFGKFDGLVFLSDAYLSNDYSWYLYDLIDPVGYKISLTIKENNDYGVDDANYIIETVNLNDMRTIPKKCNGIYKINEVSYQYVNGKLLSISWIKGNVRFSLSGTSMLYDYPNTQETIVGKMLFSNEASDILKKYLK